MTPDPHVPPPHRPPRRGEPPTRVLPGRDPVPTPDPPEPFRPQPAPGPDRPTEPAPAPRPAPPTEPFRPAPVNRRPLEPRLVRVEDGPLLLVH